MSKVTILSVHMYWDGPIAGICNWNGEDVWFAMESESADDLRRRTFGLFRLPPEVVARQWSVSRDFQDMVQSHHATEETKAAFYAKWPPNEGIVDVDSAERVGEWTEE